MVPGSWHCYVCDLGGRQPARNACFRCRAPRGETAPVASRRPQRENQAFGRAPHRPHLGLLRHRQCLALCHPRVPGAGGTVTQAVVKALGSFAGAVAKSLQPPATKTVSSREKQMAHLKEQLHNLRGRIEKQSESVRKHSEKFQLMVAKLDGPKRGETEKEGQCRELFAKKLTPSSSAARSPLASAPRSPAVSVWDDEDQRSSDDNGGYESGMDLDQRLEGGLTPPARPGGPPPLTFELPPLAPPIEVSPLLNTDADTNYVENGDDGSKRLKVDATIGQTVPDGSTLSTASPERAIHVSRNIRRSSKMLHHCCTLWRARGWGNGVVSANTMLGGPSS